DTLLLQGAEVGFQIASELVILMGIGNEHLKWRGLTHDRVIAPLTYNLTAITAYMVLAFKSLNRPT
ncbi:MAG TPA: hypothetical protein VLW53_10820, partial [Candidatus Eisenbacteria bacterium]|nr:hypothetical protein [Candidatus Eisenbacteria bacterium]